MNPRSLAVLAALALAPAASLAQEAPASVPATAPAVTPAVSPEATPARDLASDVDTVGGKVDAVAEKLAELETTVGGLKKLKLSGYVQGRFTDGEKGSYYAIYDKDGYKDLDREGFYVRRGRLKAVYDAGSAEAVIQLDATGSGVSLKEAYARLKLPFNLTIDAGQLGIPFGYEVGIVSSSNLDVLERSSIVRKLLAGEYDRGVAVGWKHGKLNAKVGVFNGNGVDGWTKDNDALKDFIGRVGYDFGIVNVGLSGWLGKLRVYEYQDLKAGVTSLDAGDYDRTRIGADVQAYLDLLPFGGTSVKAEYLQGETIIDKTDTADALKSLKTGIPQMGWYLSLTQSIGAGDAVAVRYDYHDENTDVEDGDAKAKATGTLALAWHHYFGGNLKATALYEIPTQLKGKGGFEDPKDNALTFQLQASF